MHKAVILLSDRYTKVQMKQFNKSQLTCNIRVIQSTKQWRRGCTEQDSEEKHTKYFTFWTRKKITHIKRNGKSQDEGKENDTETDKGDEMEKDVERQKKEQTGV